MYNDDGGNSAHIESVGETKIQMMGPSGEMDETRANWDVVYNNDEYGRGGVEGIIEASNNGNTERYKLQMDNKDLAQLFSAPYKTGALDNRLKNDFAMPRRRRARNNIMFITEPEMNPQIVDNSLGELLQMMEMRGQPNRSRRINVDYLSGPLRRRPRHVTKRRRRRHRTRRLRRRRPVSSERRSNIPLTEIND